MPNSSVQVEKENKNCTVRRNWIVLGSSTDTVNAQKSGRNWGSLCFGGFLYQKERHQNIKEPTLQFRGFPEEWLVHSTTCFKTRLLGKKLIDGLDWEEGQVCDVSQSPLPLFVCIGSRLTCSVASFQSAQLFLIRSRAYRMEKERMAPSCQDGNFYTILKHKWSGHHEEKKSSQVL